MVPSRLAFENKGSIPDVSDLARYRDVRAQGMPIAAICVGASGRCGAPIATSRLAFRIAVAIAARRMIPHQGEDMHGESIRPTSTPVINARAMNEPIMEDVAVGEVDQLEDGIQPS